MSHLLNAIVMDSLHENDILIRWKKDTEEIIKSGMVKEGSLTNHIHRISQKHRTQKSVLGEPVGES